MVLSRPVSSRVAAALSAGVILAGGTGPSVARAQDPVTPSPALPLVRPPASSVLPTTASDPYFFTPRDQTGCPFRTSPPPAVDESEKPRPGATAPAPPMVPSEPAGGEKLSGCGTIATPGYRTPGDVTASGWIVTDLDSGDVLAAHDPHGRYRPASVIKILLAIVAIRELDPGRIVTVSGSDLEGSEGSMVGVGPGGMYSVDRLLHGLLLQSGNDAAVVLAHQMGGIDATLEKMKPSARAWGARIPGSPASTASTSRGS